MISYINSLRNNSCKRNCSSSDELNFKCQQIWLLRWNDVIKIDGLPTSQIYIIFVCPNCVMTKFCYLLFHHVYSYHVKWRQHMFKYTGTTLTDHRLCVYGEWGSWLFYYKTAAVFCCCWHHWSILQKKKKTKIASTSAMQNHIILPKLHLSVSQFSVYSEVWHHSLTSLKNFFFGSLPLLTSSFFE